MADLGVIRTVLRTVWRPVPRGVSGSEVAAAAAAIDRMTAAAKEMNGMSRAAAIDDLAESR